MSVDQLQKLHYETIARITRSITATNIVSSIVIGLCTLQCSRALSSPECGCWMPSCGSGQMTAYLLSKGAQVTGLDISGEGIRSFEQLWPTCDAICACFVQV